MKKLLLLSIVMTLFLVACGTSENKTGSNVQVEEKKKEKSNKIELNKPMKVGNYTITFTEYKIVEDYEKKPVLRVTYDWKNESDDDSYPFTSFSLNGFQDGVETERGFVMSDQVDLGIGQKKVKKGGEIKGAHAVVGITSLDKPLLLELEKSFNISDEKMVVELNLKEIK